MADGERTHVVRIEAVDSLGRTARSKEFRIVVEPRYPLELVSRVPDIRIAVGGWLTNQLNIFRRPHNSVTKSVSVGNCLYSSGVRFDYSRQQFTGRLSNPSACAEGEAQRVGNEYHFPVSGSARSQGNAPVEFQFKIIVTGALPAIQPTTPPPSVTATGQVIQRESYSFHRVTGPVHAWRGVTYVNLEVKFLYTGDDPIEVSTYRNMLPEFVVTGVSECGLTSQARVGWLRDKLRISGYPTRTGECPIRVSVHAHGHELGHVDIRLVVEEPARTFNVPPAYLKAAVSAEGHVYLEWFKCREPNVAGSGPPFPVRYLVEFRRDSSTVWEVLTDDLESGALWWQALAAGRTISMRLGIIEMFVHSSAPVGARAEYRVSCVNEFGVGPSATVTAHVAPKVPVVRLYGSTPEPRGLRLRWTTSLDDLYFQDAMQAALVTWPSITRYAVQYREAADPAQDYTSLLMVGGPRVNELVKSATISGLLPRTAYQVRIRAQNSFGWGPWTDEAEAMTVNTVPEFLGAPDDPTIPMQRTIDENTPPGTAFGAAFVGTDLDGDSVRIRYAASSSNQDFQVLPDGRLATSATASFDHEALAATMGDEVSFTVAVEAFDDFGGVASVNVRIEVRDVDEPPLAPTGLWSARTASGIDLEWSAPHNAGRPALERYEVQYREADLVGATWHEVPSFDTYLFATLGDELDVPAIEMRVRAHNEEGAGAWSELLRVVPNFPPVFVAGTVVHRQVAENAVVGTVVGAPLVATDSEGDRVWLSSGIRQGFGLAPAGGPTIPANVRVSDSASIVVHDPAVLDYESFADGAAVVPLVIRAEDELRDGTRLTIVVEVLDVAEPPLAPINLRIADRESTTLTLHWELGDSSGRPAVDSAEVESKGPDGMRELVSLTGVSDYTSISLSNLLAGARYEFRVRAGNSDGPGSWSEWIVAEALRGNQSPAFAAGGAGRVELEAVDGRLLESRPQSRLNVGPPLQASDPDGDAVLFSVESDTTGILDVTAEGQVYIGYSQWYASEFAAEWRRFLAAGAVPETGSSATVYPVLPASRSYTAVVRAKDRYGGVAEYELTIDTRMPPATTAATEVVVREISIPENSGVGVDVGTAVPKPAVHTSTTFTISNRPRNSLPVPFSIGASDGQLRTVAGASYDFETTTSYRIWVIAEGPTATGIYNYTLWAITVYLTDVDEPPLAPTALTVIDRRAESVTVGWTAPDNIGRPPISGYEFRRDEGAESTPVAVVPESTQHGLARFDGLAAGREYRFAARAMNDEGGGGWSAWVTVTTQEREIEPPIFAEGAETSRVIAEDAGPGLTVGTPVVAMDPEHRPLTYSLSAGLVWHFTIEPTTGQIRTKAGVRYDYESIPSYVGTVTADNGSTSQDIRVTVQVTDVDELPLPLLRLVSRASGPETIELNWTIYDDTNSIPIMGHEFQYRQLPTGEFAPTVPQSTVGSVVSFGGLQPDTAYEFQARAVNRVGPGPWSNVASVTTQVVPVIFVEGAVVVRSIPENSFGSDLSVGAPVAISNWRNEPLIYELDGEAAAKFRIDGTGQIVTRAENPQLDHEAKALYTGLITVTEGSFSATAELRIDVTDVAEVPLSPWNLRVTSWENGNLILRWNNASEQGRPPTESFQFAVVSGFTVGGTYYPRGPHLADSPAEVGEDWARYEVARGSYHYKFYVRGVNHEGTGRWSAAADTLRFDGQLRFPFDGEVVLSIPENTPGGVPVGDPVAAVGTSTEQVRYSMGGSEARRAFRIDQLTGQIRTHPDVHYNHENVSEYASSVAVKGGDPWRRYDGVRVTIRIEDVDEPPHVPVQIRVVATQSDSLALNWVGIDSPDRPSITGFQFQQRVSGQQSFAEVAPEMLGRHSAVFNGLRSNTNYELRVRAVNDEGVSDWSPSVTARTTGAAEPNLLSSVTNSPSPTVDTIEVRRQVAENSPPGTAVGLPLTDAEPSAVTFSIATGAMAGFEIDRQSGQLRVEAAAELNFETRAEQALVVESTNQDGGRTQFVVLIQITDIDEPPPALATPVVHGTGTNGISVSWNTPDMAGRPAISAHEVKYRVAGTSEYVELHATLVSGTHATLTQLAPGTEYRVRVRARNDEGAGPWSGEVAARTLDVQVGVVVSSGQPAVAEAAEVTDSATATARSVEPNFSPSFGEPEMLREVSNGAAADTLVGAPVVATDRNTEDTLTYRLDEWGDAGLFEIDASSGQISVAASGLDANVAGTGYVLIVAVTDGRGIDGSLDWTTDATVRVRISVRQQTVPAGTLSRKQAAGNVGRKILSSLSNHIARRLRAPQGEAGLWVGGRNIVSLSGGEHRVVPSLAELGSPFEAPVDDAAWGGDATDLLHDSRFETTLGLSGGGPPPTASWAVWGSGETVHLTDQANGEFTWAENEVGLSHLGVEARVKDQWLAGISFSRGVGDLALESAEESEEWQWRSVGAHSYAQWSPSARFEAWAIGGAQQGDVQSQSGMLGTAEAQLFTVGGEYRLLDDEATVFGLTARTNVLRTVWTPSTQTGGDERSVEFERTQQFGVRASHGLGLERLQLTVHGQAALRGERSTDYSGSAVRITTGVQVSDMVTGWGIDAQVDYFEPVQDDHQAGHLFELALFRAVRGDQLGVAVDLRRRWSRVEHAGATGEWWADDADAFAEKVDANGSWQGSVSYGMRTVGGRQVMIPYGEVSSGAESDQWLRFGIKFDGGHRRGVWSTDLYGERSESASDEESKIGIDASIQF